MLNIGGKKHLHSNGITGITKLFYSVIILVIIQQYINNKSYYIPKFWKTVKDVFPTKEKPINLSTSASKTEKLSEANSFCKFFSNVAINIKSAAIPQKNFVWGYTNTNRICFYICIYNFRRKRAEKFEEEKSCWN